MIYQNVVHFVGMYGIREKSRIISFVQSRSSGFLAWRGVAWRVVFVSCHSSGWVVQKQSMQNEKVPIKNVDETARK